MARGGVAAVWPRVLRRGDRVALVAPASAPDPERVEAGRALLKRWDLLVDDWRPAERDWRFAATDGERRESVQALLDDDAVAGILSARGGYGTQRIVDDLDVRAFVARRGVFVGFSDVTALITKLNRTGLVAYHGPALAWDAARNGARARRSLRAALFGGSSIELTGEPSTPSTGRPARAVEGPVVGGNLTLLASCVGTPTALDARGAIVMLEDDGETSRRVDRMLTQLLRAGALAGAIGFVLGQFTDQRDAADRPVPADAEGRPMLAVVRERLAPLGVPVVAGFAVGHGDEQLTLPLGAVGRLDPTTGRLSFTRRPPPDPWSALQGT